MDINPKVKKNLQKIIMIRNFQKMKISITTSQVVF